MGGIDRRRGNEGGAAIEVAGVSVARDEPAGDIGLVCGFGFDAGDVKIPIAKWPIPVQVG